jgi:hypothetical protein
MDAAVRYEGHSHVALQPVVTVSAAYEGSATDIAAARHLAREFLARVQADHGLPVSDRAMGTVQLVVSELITNSCKHAPGPCLLDLEVDGDAIKITVWDSEPMPVKVLPGPGRHRLTAAAPVHGPERTTLCPYPSSSGRLALLTPATVRRGGPLS